MIIHRELISAVNITDCYFGLTRFWSGSYIECNEIGEPVSTPALFAKATMQATEANLASQLLARLSDLKGRQVKSGHLFVHQMTDAQEQLFWKVLNRPDMSEQMDTWFLDDCATFTARQGSVSVWR